MDEPGLFTDLIPFLKRVLASRRCVSVLLVCSNAWCIEGVGREFPVVRHHLRDWLAPVLEPEKLDAVWYKTLFRDMLCPSRCTDGAGLWHLGSWVSQHLGEATSLRKIAATMFVFGSRVSHPTVDAYIRAYQNAFLLDRVECYDLFTGTPSRSGFRLAVNFPRLFVHSFAVDRVALARAISWNEAYLQLRREHDVVYFPKCGHADFVTLAPGGKAVCWLEKGGVPVPRDQAEV